MVSLAATQPRLRCTPWLGAPSHGSASSGGMRGHIACVQQTSANHLILLTVASCCAQAVNMTVHKPRLRNFPTRCASNERNCARSPTHSHLCERPPGSRSELCSRTPGPPSLALGPWTKTDHVPPANAPGYGPAVAEILRVLAGRASDSDAVDFIFH